MLQWLNWQGGVEGFIHKLYMDNFLSFPDLYGNLAQKKFPVVGLWGYIEMDLKPKTHIETW